MEARHGGEVLGQNLGVSGLQLRDEVLHVGGDDGLRVGFSVGAKRGDE